jgi:FkbM family methyltransferase
MHVNSLTDDLRYLVLSAGYSLQRQWFRRWPFRRGRGLPATLTRKIARQTVPIWTNLGPDIRLRLSPTDLISRAILETGDWEPDTWAAIREHLRPGAIFVDIGAHIGFCALKAKGIVGPSGRVVAVEANPEMQSALRANIKASGTEVIVAPFACSDTEAMLELYSGSQSNSGSSSLSKANASTWGPIGAIHQVRARPLDSILNELEISHVDVLKVDVEGAEFGVLLGARELLKRDHPVLMLELDEPLLKSMGSSTEAVLALLHTYGYRCSDRFDDTNYKFTADEDGIGKGKR